MRARLTSGRRPDYQPRHRAPKRTGGARAATGLALPTAAAVLTLTAGGVAVAAADVMAVGRTAANAAVLPTAVASAVSTRLLERREEQAGETGSRTLAAARASRSFERQELAEARLAAANQAAAAAAARTAAVAAQKAAAAKAAAARAAAAHRWQLPLTKYVLSSSYGMRWGRLHAGNDFSVPVGSRLSSMSSGTVIFAGYSGGYGYKVEIRYWDGTVSYYGHMSRIVVKKGAVVTPGQLVGYSGNTGHSTGPHLHLEIHPGGGRPVNPASWLAARGIKL